MGNDDFQLGQASPCCNKIAETEAVVSVNEKKLVVRDAYVYARAADAI
jgi:hypothetical protein